MSSASDSLKQLAEAQATDEPNTKKAKLNEIETKDEKTVDANNGNVPENNSKSTSSNNNYKISNNTINGKNKELNHDDGDEDGDEGSEGRKYSGDDDVGEEGILDPKVTAALNQVENIQLEIFNLNEKASDEILKVEQKFNKLRRPHFEKRNELLKEIPNFWVTSLANHPIIAPMIESAEDEDCLHYMVNLDVEEYEDIKSGYKLNLHFVENPYIANEVITKEFQIVSSEEVVSVETHIEFKNTPKGQSLKRIVETSIAQNRRGRRPGSTQQSFFAWLVESSEPGADDIAEILKDQIWPNPLEFFLSGPEDYGADDDSDDEDEEIDDDEELDDEEDGVITGGNIDFSDEDLDDEDEDDEDDVE